MITLDHCQTLAEFDAESARRWYANLCQWCGAPQPDDAQRYCRAEDVGLCSAPSLAARNVSTHAYAHQTTRRRLAKTR